MSILTQLLSMPANLQDFFQLKTLQRYFFGTYNNLIYLSNEMIEAIPWS